MECTQTCSKGYNQQPVSCRTTRMLQRQPVPSPSFPQYQPAIRVLDVHSVVLHKLIVQHSLCTVIGNSHRSSRCSRSSMSACAASYCTCLDEVTAHTWCLACGIQELLQALATPVVGAVRAHLSVGTAAKHCQHQRWAPSLPLLRSLPLHSIRAKRQRTTYSFSSPRYGSMDRSACTWHAHPAPSLFKRWPKVGVQVTHPEM